MLSSKRERAASLLREAGELYAPAVFATRVRFYQQQGYDATVALSSGAIMTATSWFATIVLDAEEGVPMRRRRR